MDDATPSISSNVSKQNPFDYWIRLGDAISITPKGRGRPRIGMAWGVNKDCRHSTFRYVKLHHWDTLLRHMKGQGPRPDLSHVLRMWCRTQMSPVDTDLLVPSVKDVYDAIQEELPQRLSRAVLDIDDRSLY